MVAGESDELENVFFGTTIADIPDRTTSYREGARSMLGIQQRWRETVSVAIFAGLLTVPGQALLAFGPPVDTDLDQPVAEVCTGEKLGTTITWYDDSQFAARLAREQGKLVFLIQVSGNFAREEFT